MKSLPHKSLGITILLAVLVSGVGHIYLGIIKKGIIILIIGIAIAIIVPMFVPYPFSWIIGGLYWVWQLVIRFDLIGKGYLEYCNDCNNR